MARFYGVIQGARGPASRLGHANSGLRVTAQTWSSSFTVNLWANDTKDEKVDYGSVSLGNFQLFSGPVDQFSSEDGAVEWIISRLRDPKLRSRVLLRLAHDGLLEEASHG